uniref:Retrotransposon Copia-like N-terminal domain-containing protein n=1 Tax=Oryza glumipatula TaxID=40148 RepID=A0A0E0AVF0_9ORYZ
MQNTDESVAARPRAMMSSPTPAPLLPVAPLDGGGGYLRWKESVLLRLRTLDLAYVLSEHQPEDGRTRDDELCRGHILATLSDRLLPDYAHHATAAAAWRALARTYDMDGKLPNLPLDRFFAYRFVDGEPVLEQLAHLEAMGVAGKLDDRTMYGLVHQKLPPALVKAIALASPPRGRVCAVKFAVASTLRTRKTTTTKEETTQMKITGARNGRGAIAGRATTVARRGTSPGTAEDELDRSVKR